MANEVSISVSLAISKLGVTNILSRSYTRDLAGTNQLSNVQTLGTSAELLSIVDLANIAHPATSPQNFGSVLMLAATRFSPGHTGLPQEVFLSLFRSGLSVESYSRGGSTAADWIKFGANFTFFQTAGPNRARINWAIKDSLYPFLTEI